MISLRAGLWDWKYQCKITWVAILSCACVILYISPLRQTFNFADVEEYYLVVKDIKTKALRFTILMPFNLAKPTYLSFEPLFYFFELIIIAICFPNIPALFHRCRTNPIHQSFLACTSQYVLNSTSPTVNSHFSIKMKPSLLTLHGADR
ncbi:MAG: hypothetical protein K0Q48_3110 [Bacillota bacterium]|nr:hypothetical protein [Bacillota bacterium]